MTKQKKKIRFLDYECQVNETVQWTNMLGARFQGIILKWQDEIATIKLEDGTEIDIKC